MLKPGLNIADLRRQSWRDNIVIGRSKLVGFPREYSAVDSLSSADEESYSVSDVGGDFGDEMPDLFIEEEDSSSESSASVNECPIVAEGLFAEENFTNFANYLSEVPEVDGQIVAFEDYFKHVSSVNFSYKGALVDQLSAFGQKRSRVPDDAEESILPGYTLVTKRRFAARLKAFVDLECLPLRTADKLLLTINNMFDFCDLPESDRSSASFSGSFTRMLRYCGRDFRGLLFSQCYVNGCCVFVGDLADGKRCPSCGSYRFTPCKRLPCKNVLSRGDESYCHHNDRTPHKVIHYRGLLNLFEVLLRTKNFVACVNYDYVHVFPGVYDHKTRPPSMRYCDVMDGETAKMNMRLMRIKFEDKRVTDPSLIEVSLVLSHFYDGLQMFKKKVVNFWPLLVQILNLPPTLRSHNGVGIFTLGLFSGLTGSVADEFLLGECFVQELHLLAEGLVFTILGKRYFVQARLIAHQMDTKGFEKVMNCQASNSLIGCPVCRSCSGRTHPGFGRGTYYIGHRINLPQNHKLRVFGSGLTVKSSRAFVGSVNVLPLSKVEKVAEVLEFNEFDETKWTMPASKCERKLASYKKLLRAGNVDVGPGKFYFEEESIGDTHFYGVWYHDEDKFGRTAFHENLFYSHCELRKQVVHVRKSNEWYVQCGSQAAKLSTRRAVPVATDAMRNHGVYFTQKSKRREAVDGVAGLWFAKSLPYVRYEDTYWCTMHVLKNVYGSLRSSLTGFKTDKRKDKYFKYCKMNYMHSYVWDNRAKNLPPWQLDVSCQNVADAYLSSILLPSGHGNHVQAKEIFRHPERTNSHAAKVLLLVILPYLLDRTRLAGSYKIFVWMLSTDLVDLYRPYHGLDSIEKLHNRMIETVAIHDGMFPPFDCTFAWHQLIDVPKMIVQLGAVEGWSGFWGERYLGVIKKQCPSGGGSFEVTVMDRVHRMEMSKLKWAFNSGTSSSSICNLQNMLKEDTFLKVNSSGNVSFSYFRPLLRRKCKGNSEFDINPFETNMLLNAFVSEIRLRCTDDEVIAVKASSLYRMFVAFLFHEQRFLYLKPAVAVTFESFLHSLYTEVYEEFSRDLPQYLFQSRRRITSFSGTRLLLFCKEGKIFLEDLSLVCGQMYGSDVLRHAYLRMSIYGVKFSGRGFRFRETSDNFEKANPLNKLINFWHHPRNYSSWCRYRNSDCLLQGNDSSFSFAQVNCFHKLWLPAEPLIHNSTIASVTTHRHMHVTDAFTGLKNLYATVEFSEASTVEFESCPKFIFAKYIVPTAIGVVGIVEERTDRGAGLSHKPWASLEIVRRNADTTNCYAAVEPSKVSFLHLIDLHPQNSEVKVYESN